MSSTDPTASLDDTRPFGTHIRMAWWKSLIVIAVLPLTLLLLQLVLYLLAGLVEGGDPLESTLTPLKLLAANLSTGLTALLAVVLVSRFAKVPWRRIFSSPGRFALRRLATYFAGSAVLVGVGVAVVAVVVPDGPGWMSFGVSGTTVALLAVVLLSTPIQSAGEEVIFRGAVLPAAGSWVRAVQPAFLTGLVVSSLLFAAVHGAGDPWLISYYVLLSVCTALMGRISRSLEAATGFHVANNLVTTTVNVLLADGGSLVVNRTEGAGGGPSLLVLAAVNLGVLAFVWLRERANRSRSRGLSVVGDYPAAHVDGAVRAEAGQDLRSPALSDVERPAESRGEHHG
ncbi:CAAX amino terminal protease family protein [Actinoplanes friuliensis DSM 7358]|uniref:CAAX amino terminal protease family protein n=1 Tax=Actinoplanes friuliensis DSM 7358 TaxID=1246995 RepID=U5W4D5_9ACTN|nr:CPBP family intramembrane glutamic endopeptidase [Actinoplanes friuliensis]AGZ44048.1 CAAX amino terminal protease family protein [Actinoplanes friuliensis DSM 7358]